jgi:hypothetical protein
MNTSGEAVDGWELTWDFRTGQEIGSGWNGVFEQEGSAVTVTNAAWNRTIAPGARSHDRPGSPAVQPGPGRVVHRGAGSSIDFFSPLPARRCR